MPMAKTRRGRLRQIEAWLRDRYPAPYPTEVVVRALPQSGEERAFGCTEKIGRRVRITIHSRLTWHHAIECLIHEWAHAMVWRPQHVERRRDEFPHDEEWSAAYGRIYRDYYDGDGCADSREYPAR